MGRAVRAGHHHEGAASGSSTSPCRTCRPTRACCCAELARTAKTLAALRGLRLCAEDGTTGEDTIFQRIRPTTRTTLVSSLRLLLQRLADRRCDAIVSDAPILGAERAAVPDSYGPLAGQIRTNERYGAVLAQGSPLKPAVNEALKTLIADGTVGQLSKRWLTVDVSKLRILR